LLESLDKLVEAASPTVLAAVAAVAAGARLTVARLCRNALDRRLRAACFLLRAASSSVAAFALLALVGRRILFVSGLPLTVVGPVIGLATELLLDVYSVERRIVPPRSGRTLTLLRILLFVAAAATLLQPVFRIEKHHSVRRTVAVLLDGSASMDVSDDRMPLDERLALARSLLPDFPPPPGTLWNAVELCRRARSTIERLASAPNLADSATASAVEGLRRDLETLAGNVEQALRDASRIPEAPTKSLEAAAWFIRKRLLPALPQSNRTKAPDPGPTLRKMLPSVSRMVSVIEDCARRMDAAWFAALPASQRRAVDELAAQPRRALAERILSGSDAGDERTHPGLLARIRQSGRHMRLFTFAGRCVSTDPADVAAASPRNAAPAGIIPDRTNIAAALDTVLRAVPADRLAGVVLLTDARHNAPGSVDPPVHQLALLHVPVHIVLFGDPDAPPTDAAVADVQAPDTIYAGDAPGLDIEVAAGGLRETPLTLDILEDNRVIVQRTLRPDSDRWRKRILVPLPPPAPGTHDYTVRLHPPPNDAVPANNERRRRIRVRSDAIGLLVIEDRPRWEFRYLKNLFSGRDRSVRSQIVLLDPDRIPGVTVTNPAPAALSRAPEHVLADAPPASEEEWLKFDVVVLGDVPRTGLPDRTLKFIEKFVARKGGTLVVISGPRAMPHHFADTPLAPLLPVEIAGGPGADSADWLPPPEQKWRLCATDEGFQSGLVRFADDIEANHDVLAGLPPFYWRHSRLKPRPNARVLAWALPPEHPPFVRADGKPQPATPETLQAYRRFIRDHAVILWQRYGLGRVLLLTFDRTWRLRCRRGDVLHHRFWGQVLRWAAPNCLPDGDELLRAGTDKAVYTAGEPVLLRASVRRSTLEPVTDASVHAILIRDRDPAGEIELRYVPDSPGVYEVRVADLAPGDYTARVKVSGKGPTALSSRTVLTHFTIVRAVSGEKVFLAPDRQLADRVASLTGGLVLRPSEETRILDALLPPVAEQREIRDIVVWNSWPWLLAVLAAACAEWFVRKRRRLP